MALIVAILVICLSRTCLSAPYPQSDDYVNRESKKDIFISRGWGAGGMPFSVLYMNPTFSSPKAHAPVQTNFRQQNASKNQHKSLPQVRTSMRQKTVHRAPHSVIPQLFVSYGWGPLGR